VNVAKEVFDRIMPGRNQLHVKRDDVCVKASDLLAFAPQAPITEQGLRTNISVNLQYMGSWLAGNGCVPVNNLMEDAATAEISRTQLWQWIHHGAKLDSGAVVDERLYRMIRDQELATIGERPHIKRAARLFDDLILSDTLADFLTIPAYEQLLKLEQN
jgi:malate synthase